MLKGNWIAIDKHITAFLPKHRPYTEAEAFLSIAVDVDNLAYKTGKLPTSSSEAIELLMSKNSISGYASLWGWTRNKVRRFIEYIKKDSGHPTDTRRTGSGHPIRLIFNSLQDNADGYRTDSGQIADTSYNPQYLTLNPKTKKHSRASLETEDFLSFYSAFPKKRNRPQAIKAWTKINPTPELIREIMQGLESAKASEEWNRESGRYIPYPASWLNAEGWLNDYTT